jgi:hypothetical protein
VPHHRARFTARGRDDVVRRVVERGAEGGEFYGPCYVDNGPPVRKPIVRRIGMDRAIARLWEVSERETGLKLEVGTAVPARS